MLQVLSYVTIFKDKKYEAGITQDMTCSEKTVFWVGLVTDEIFLFFYDYFLLNLDVFFIVPSQHSFLKLQFHISKLIAK